ncbi:MAG: glycosyltransferase, partial [Candidatus Sericytochromatia bacterium]|nr:glycosyltransferase [Candidatus Sericytochromatia bacterium]
MVNKIVSSNQDLIYATYFYADLENSRFESLDILENFSTSFILNSILENSSFLGNFIFKKTFLDKKILKNKKYLNEFDFYTHVAKKIKSPEINKLVNPVYAIFDNFIDKLSNDSIIALNNLFVEKLKNDLDISITIEQLIKITEQFGLLSLDLKIVVLNVFNEIYKNDLIENHLKDLIFEYNTKTKRKIDQSFDIALNLDFESLESFFKKSNLSNNCIYIHDNNYNKKKYFKEYYKELDLLFYYNNKSNSLRNSYLINYCSWDFGYLPENWKHLFNNKIDQVWVSSQHIKDKLIASDINKQKIYVIREGIDTGFFRKTDENNTTTGKNQAFNFLFIGDITNFKGVELLLDCFINELSTDKNISLTIASKNIDPNLYISIKSKIKQLKEKNKQKINFIENSLLDNELLLNLYNLSDCLIYPYKIEGNGKVIMQAMSCQLPVIVTGGGVSLDFCNNNNSYLINCEEKEYEDLSIKEFDIKGPIIAFEPDKDHLKTIINHVYTHQDEAKEKAKKARETILNNFTLQNTSQDIKIALEKLEHKLIFR